MIKLSNRYTVIVPSDFNSSGYSREQAQQETEVFLSKLCGGCTTSPARGNYLNDSGVLVKEEVDIVFAYSDKDVADKLRAFAIEACKRWHQECVAIEHSNALWLVSQDDQPVL